jgi:hypothetical protein
VYFVKETNIFSYLDNKEECENDNTTAAEVSDDTDRDEESCKRIRKKKNYGSEFQTGMDIFLCSKDNKFMLVSFTKYTKLVKLIQLYSQF